MTLRRIERLLALLLLTTLPQALLAYGGYMQQGSSRIQINSYWDQAGIYNIRITQQGLDQGDIRAYLRPGRLVIESRQGQNRESGFGQMWQSSSMQQSVPLPRQVNPRRMSLVQTNDGLHVRIPAW